MARTFHSNGGNAAVATGTMYLVALDDKFGLYCERDDDARIARRKAKLNHARLEVEAGAACLWGTVAQHDAAPHP
ncbi:hypothetical protein SPHV1_180006 [Novosphingobium sp. KN65.2]|nr:hypothetical protein SPHV1_180006 [Novosphingobium sp. KN65.2]